MSHVCRAVTFAVFGAAKCEETLFLMALWSLGGWGRNRTADTIPLLEFMIFRRKPRQKTLTNTGAFLNLFLTDFVATVWKHPASPYWSAVFRDEQNVWRKKTTKRRERTKALAMAIEWERAARLGREGILTEMLSREIIGGILERTA